MSKFEGEPEDKSFYVDTLSGRKKVIAYLTDEGEEIAVEDALDTFIEPTAEDLADPGRTILALVVKEVIVRLKNQPGGMKAADFEFCRKLMQDNSITLASVRQGNFGAVAQRVADEFAMDYPVQ